MKRFLKVLAPAARSLHSGLPKQSFSLGFKQPLLNLRPKILVTRPAFHFSKNIVEVPKMGDSITEGTVHKFEKQPGDFVEADEIVAVIETDKIKCDIRSPEAGKIVQYFANEGDTVEVGKKFFELDTDAKNEGGSSKKVEQSANTTPSSDQENKKKIEANEQKSTKKEEPKKEEPKKEEPKKDAPKREEPKKEKSKETSKPAAPQPPKKTSGPASREERREPMNRMRLKIGQRLKDAQNTYALLTTFQEVDMSAAMQYRTELQAEFQKKHNVKLGFMSFFVKASVAALRDQPIVNAVIDGKDIVHRDYVDISVAVATPSGLMVPVLRNCEAMGFADVERELINLANKGREGKIGLEDMAGGTFTISNGGVYGSLMGTPILNPPQSAILGMHAIINRPVVRNDQIVARPMMYLALTYDHRIVDGREAATFLKKIQSEIEDPRRLLFDL